LSLSEICINCGANVNNFEQSIENNDKMYGKCQNCHKSLKIVDIEETKLREYYVWSTDDDIPSPSTVQKLKSEYNDLEFKVGLNTPLIHIEYIKKPKKKKLKWILFATCKSPMQYGGTY